MNKMALLIALPLLLAFIIPVLSRYSAFLAKVIGPMSLAFLLGIIVSAWNALDGDSASIYIGGFLPPLGITFYVDQFALLFSGLVAIMFFACWPWSKVSEAREYALYMLMAAASFGLVLSADLFNLYVFYELLAVASYGLIGKQDHPGASAAALRYLLISSAGSVMLLIGIAVIYTLTGTLNIAHLSIIAPDELYNLAGLSAFVMIAVGAGVKAEMFSINSWVPEVYAVVPRSLAALMAGLISKLAVVLIVRVLLMLYQQTEALQLLLVFGVLGVISGELVAWRAKDMVRMLSFSSIAQLGAIFIAFSMPGDTGLWVGLALMLHHLLVKSGLFFLAERLNGSFDSLTGIARQSPMAVAIFVVFILSLLGVPPFPGFWVKLLLITQLAAQESYIYSVAIAFILIATVIEASYLFKLIRLMYQSDKATEKSDFTNETLSYRISQVFVLVLVFIMFMVSPIADQLHLMAKKSANQQLYIEAVFPGVSHSHDRALPTISQNKPSRLTGESL